jgi:uncharacterized protein YbaR (Trm112 family)
MESAALVHCVGILRCPITGQVLSILSPAEIAECNRRQASDALVYRNGTPAPIAVTFALGTPGRDQIYRVEDSIPWLLPDLALIDTAAVGTASFTAERKVVQSFYDEYGWVKSDDGLFNDTAQFTDTSTFTRDYQRYCNARIGRELPGGQYLLDVASGAIPHAEYLEFSRGYKIRICVDFSIRALREARAKLGEDGLYLLSDITRLPLASDIVDTVISLPRLSSYDQLISNCLGRSTWSSLVSIFISSSSKGICSSEETLTTCRISYREASRCFCRLAIATSR